VVDDTTTAIAPALDQIRPRLKQLIGPQGERAHARARSVSKKASAE
jgi:hypothetical protein